MQTTKYVELLALLGVDRQDQREASRDAPREVGAVVEGRVRPEQSENPAALPWLIHTTNTTLGDATCVLCFCSAARTVKAKLLQKCQTKRENKTKR